MLKAIIRVIAREMSIEAAHARSSFVCFFI